MKFKKSIQYLITERVSRRDYTRLKIDQKIRKKIDDCLSCHYNGPFNNEVKFRFLDTKNNDQDKKVQIGTYGMISGARYYIAAISKNTPEAIIDVGYTFEQIILKMTEFELGTCWLGAKFTNQKLTKQIQLPENEFIPAITPIGIPKIEQTLKEKVIAWGISARKRKPWSNFFFKEDFNLNLAEKEAGKFKIPLEMIRLAPSAKNLQPWRIVKDSQKNNYHFFVDVGNYFPYKQNKVPKLKLLDIGIAICHFDLSIKEIGLKGKWEKSDPNIDAKSNIHYIISWKQK